MDATIVSTADCQSGHVDDVIGCAGDVVRSADGEMAGDCRGLNFYDADPSLAQLLALGLPAEVLGAVRGELRRLGALAGTRLDELAFDADANPPKLHARDRLGRDEDWIEYHAAYRELERYAYCEFGIHAIGRRAGLLGFPGTLPSVVKYVCQYLFVQSEFGLVCPVAMTDSCAHVVQTHGDETVRRLFLPGLTATEPASLLKGAQMMTERQAGSDVGAIRTRAEPGAIGWEITGEKWFCSAADADVIMVLARSRTGSTGTSGLSLFAVPRVLPEGGRNTYALRRLKSKLGTRSMPTGEVEFRKARGYLVGREGSGLRIVLEQVNMSRLSHGVRAAGMMRRCYNEAMAVANSRRAFGRLLVQMPVVRMQLLRIRLAAEASLSMVFAAAEALERSRKGDAEQSRLLRILTPLVKLGACRDNVEVATLAMELRGGNGFVADYVNERLVRDAQTGLIWEGTSNIIAHDLVARAVGKDCAHEVLLDGLSARLARAEADLPRVRLFGDLRGELDRAAAKLVEIGRRDDAVGGAEHGIALYHAVAASLMALEGAELLRSAADGRRLRLAWLVGATRLWPAASAGEDVLRGARRALDEAPVDAEEHLAFGLC